MASSLWFFRWPFLVTVLGLMLATWLGWQTTGTGSGALTFFLIGAVLAVLEISLSFDNAIVNANKLKDMSPVWQKRFLTWGILIAVFGMRIIFPLAIVAIAAQIGPFAAIQLAATEPAEYARLIGEAHMSISAFGGTFLMMVGLTYFIDDSKEVDWFCALECQLRRCASVRGLQVGLVLALVMVFASCLSKEDGTTFLFSALLGLLTFMAVDLLGHVLDASQEARDIGRVGGLGAFMYLEVLDASFSFDGVIGAFALTQNLFLVAIGLGIGAMYVRSMTIMLVERETLAQFRYLEHGAFYSILALSIIMFAQSLFHISEFVTGALGAGLIGASLYASIRYKKHLING